MADKLKMDYINSLPQPFMATFYGGDEWMVDFICVQTGCMRVDVCGLGQNMHFDEVKFLTDADGVEHDVDDFYINQPHS